MSFPTRWRRIEWIRFLLSTDAAKVQSDDLLGIIVDHLVVVHRFQQVEGGLQVTNGGTTCTVPRAFSPTVPVPTVSKGWMNWLQCRSGCSISPMDDQQFSVVIHDARIDSGRQTSWPIRVGVQEDDYYSALLYSDQDIVIHGHLREPDSPLELPWPAKTVVTVHLSAETNTIATIRFSVNDQWSSKAINLPRGPDARWIPTVGIRAGMYSDDNIFAPYNNSISFL